MDLLQPNVESVHGALELLLKGIFPDTPVYQANMPFAKMDEMTRSCAKSVTYLVQKDAQRRNNDGLSGVHDCEIEVNLFGGLEEIDRMGEELVRALTQGVCDAGGWCFALTVKDKKDVWESAIKAKRMWFQFSGVMFQEEG